VKCRRPRSCASLPRRRASAAQVAELDEQVAGVLAYLIGAHRREGIPLPPALGGPQPLRLIQGGAA
jgi:hypothetical protein